MLRAACVVRKGADGWHQGLQRQEEKMSPRRSSWKGEEQEITSCRPIPGASRGDKFKNASSSGNSVNKEKCWFSLLVATAGWEMDKKVIQP